MEKKEGGKGVPPEFLSTHPGYERRVQQLRSFMSEALSYYQPSNVRVELLPAPESLDSPAAKSERELLKRIQAINRYVEQQNGERPLVEALAYELRLNPQSVLQERQQLRVGYGQYAALRGVSYLGRGSINRILADYQRGQPWSEIAQAHGTRLNELTVWLNNVIRTTSSAARQPRNQQFRPSLRAR
jgi:hypothetical protein